MRVDLQRTVAECGSKAAREEWLEAQLTGEYAEYIGLALPGACMHGQGVCVPSYLYAGVVRHWCATASYLCAELLVGLLVCRVTRVPHCMWGLTLQRRAYSPHRSRSTHPTRRTRRTHPAHTTIYHTHSYSPYSPFSLYSLYPPYSPYSPYSPYHIPHALYSLGDEAFLEIAREGMRETTEGCPEGWAIYVYMLGRNIYAQMDLPRYASCTYCSLIVVLTH